MDKIMGVLSKELGFKFEACQGASNGKKKKAMTAEEKCYGENEWFQVGE